MHRKKDEINEEINKLLSDLEKIALEDDTITSDEKAILDQIKKDAGNLQKQVMQILESNLEESEFKDLLHDIILDLVNDATKIAKADDIITTEEEALLHRIRSFSEKMRGM